MYNLSYHVMRAICSSATDSPYRLRLTVRVMSANGVPRRLARGVAWAVAMSTAAYGVEAIWEGQGVEVMICHFTVSINILHVDRSADWLLSLP